MKKLQKNHLRRLRELRELAAVKVTKMQEVYLKCLSSRYKQLKLILIDPLNQLNIRRSIQYDNNITYQNNNGT